MKKVLVIEDESAVRLSLVELLMAENFKPISAENGSVGLQLAREQTPDLIICDIMMPEMNGYEVLKELRTDQITASIPFLFLTAKSERTDLRKAMELGADDYITKPFTRNDILNAINIRMQKAEETGKHVRIKLDELRSDLSRTLFNQMLPSLNKIVNLSKSIAEEYTFMSIDRICEYSLYINNYAVHLSKLIQNLLLYSVLEIISSRPDRLNALRNSCLSNPRAVITEAAVQKADRADRSSDLYLKLHDIPVQIMEIHLVKIVDELLDNSFKYSQPGTTVRITSAEGDNGYVLFFIDYGKGMSPDMLNNIGKYIDFEQSNNNQKNSGFGLAIVMKLVDLYNGKFSIRSEKDTGTTITIELPVLL
jgi:two-component system, sensor histidine kinase and response regulator